MNEVDAKLEQILYDFQSGQQRDVAVTIAEIKKTLGVKVLESPKEPPNAFKSRKPIFKNGSHAPSVT